MKLKSDIKSYVWGQKRKKMRPSPLVNIFYEKEKYYNAFESLRQALLEYLFLVEKISICEKHQKWIDEVFGWLVDIDSIIIDYEKGERTNSDISEFLEEEACSVECFDYFPSLLIEFSNDSDFQNLLDELTGKLENEYDKTRDKIYSVYNILMETSNIYPIPYDDGEPSNRLRALLGESLLRSI